MEPLPEKIAALRIVRMEIGALNPHPRNPRKHPEPGSPKWVALQQSIAYDYFDPLVFNQRNGMLVSGHLRKKILLAEGYTHADVSVVDYDEQTHLARLVAANQFLGEWEEEVLGHIAAELRDLPAGLSGWTEKELAALLDGPQVDDDTTAAAELVSQAEEIQRERNVCLGDIYAAGDHRIFCGDCTEAPNWQFLLGDQLADIVWTDPPYNVDYDSIQRRRIELNTEKGKASRLKPEAILNDSLSDVQYAALLNRSMTAAFGRTKPGGTIYVAHADSQGLITRQAVAAAGWHVAQCIIWVKNAFTLGRQDYQWQHEPILYGWKPGGAHYWQGGDSQASIADDEETNLKKASKDDLIDIIQRLRNARDTTIVREPRNTCSDLHPTVKPLPLVARQIWNSSRRGDLVLELFGGSGTTILAAEQTGRRAVAMELDPKFCAVILERLSRAGLAIEKLGNHSVDGGL